MPTDVLPLGIKLWCREGIPFPEIVARVSERSDLECAFGAAVVMQECRRGPQILEKICELVDHFQDTKKILDAMKEKRIEAREVLPGDDAKAFFEEINALMVEHYVRLYKMWVSLGCPEGRPPPSQ